MTDKDPSLWLKIQMNPAIQSKKDREDLLQGLKNGFIDYLATDHAPHTLEEKYSAFSKFRDRYKKTNIEIAENIYRTDKKLYQDTCKENGMSGAPWLDVYSFVCVYLMKKYDFKPQDIARVTSYNPGLFVNKYLKKQFTQNYGKGFGRLDV